MNTIKPLNKKGKKMAKKPVKKAVAKKAPAKKVVAVKAPVAKTMAKKPVVKSAVAPETKVVVETPAVTCASGCGCGKSCGFCRFVRKLIVFFVIFALGYSAAMYCPYGRHFMRNGPRMHEIFANGCLDVTKLPNPDMAEKVKTADTNADNCISKEEFDAVRAEMGRPEMPTPAEKQAMRR